MGYFDEFFWQPVPICFACGKELGTGPEDVIYVGWGHRQEGEGPKWVTALCPCQQPPQGQEEPSSCMEAARQYAATEGLELSAHQYLEWLKSA